MKTSFSFVHMSVQKGKYNDGIIFCVTCSAYLLLFFYLISSYTRLKIIHSRFANVTVANSFFPGRWNVYTRRPGEPLLRLYYIEDGKLIPTDQRPFVPRYAFGIRRDYKIQSGEMAFLMQDTILTQVNNKYKIQVPEGADINNYIKPDTLTFNSYSSGNVRFLTGRLVITKEQPVQWENERKHIAWQKHITLVPFDISHK